MTSEGVFTPSEVKKSLSRDVPALYFHFEEDGSIRAGSHRIKKPSPHIGVKAYIHGTILI
ncbi:hypothetical protein FDC51_12720 [Clostridium botulinum]|nr:hypothetical protein [Clostridium botulinum]